MADSTANRSGREALRGVEIEVLDLIAEVLTSDKWAELLRGPLERAAGQGNRGLAQKLVEAGAQIGGALHAAVRGGHGEVVEDLLKNGVSINAKDTEYGRTPLHSAAREGHSEMVQLLMLKGADMDMKDRFEYTPLYHAVHRGHAATALALLGGGADVSIQCGEFKGSVVHAAAAHGHVDVLRAMIEHGADVNHVELRLQFTALHLAACNGKAQAITLLVDAGADIEARDTNGRTPLSWASTMVNLEALTALLRHGAHVNSQDDALHTPLHYSAAEVGVPGAAEVVHQLLRSGADETILDDEGKTAADVVAIFVEEEDRLAEDVERVRKLLANAPADRAWRRRGYLVLCRAHPDRVQHVQEISSTHAGLARRTRHDAKLQRPGASSCNDGVRAVVEETIAANWACAVASVLELKEEGIFRTIVGYL